MFPLGSESKKNDLGLILATIILIACGAFLVLYLVFWEFFVISWFILLLINPIFALVMAYAVPIVLVVTIIICIAVIIKKLVS